MTNKPTKGLHPKYRPDIDGLRAMAILSVVGFHAFPNLIKGGFIGVDIFFVISGYLISSIIFSNLEHHCFSLADFYNRRIRRIFPALIVVMLTLLVVGRWVLPTHCYAYLGKHILNGAGFYSNFALYRENGYFDIKSDTKPLLHLWSLAIEEQFYFIWPLLLMIVWIRRWNFLFITTCIAILSFISSLYLFYHDPIAAFYYPIARFWELMMGGILAYITLHKPALTNRFTNIQASIGIIFIVIGLLFINKNLYLVNVATLLPTLGAFFLISSGQKSWFNKYFLSNQILVWIGLISYPLYLWHWPLISFLNIIEKDHVSLPLRLTAVILSFVLAALTFHFIEKPMRHNKHSKTKTITLIILMIILGIAGHYICVKKGLNTCFYTNQNLNDKSLPAGVIENYFDKNNWSKWRDSGCAKEYLNISTNCKSITHAPPVILLIGDSHTQELYQGLVDLLGKSKGNIMRFGTYLPLYNTAVKLDMQTPESSADETNRELDFAVSSPSVKTIIISFRGVRIFTGTNYDSLKAEPIEGLSFRIIGNKTNGKHLFEIALRNTLFKLSQSHKQVIFIVDKPELGFDPKECFDLVPFHFLKPVLQDPCAIPRKAFDERNLEYRAIVFSALKDYPNIQIFDPALNLCDNNWCWAMKDGKVLYQDDNHLSIDGSHYVVKQLLNDIKL